MERVICRDVVTLVNKYPEYFNYNIHHYFETFNTIYVNHVTEEILLEDFDYNFDENEKTIRNDDECLFKTKPNVTLNISDLIYTIKTYSIPDHYKIHLKYRVWDLCVYINYATFCEVNKLFHVKSTRGHNNDDNNLESIHFGCCSCRDFIFGDYNELTLISL